MQHDFFAFINRFVIEFGQCDETREKLTSRNDSSYRMIRTTHLFHSRLNGWMQLLHRINWKMDWNQERALRLYDIYSHLDLSSTISSVLIAAMPADKFLSLSSSPEKYFTTSVWNVSKKGFKIFDNNRPKLISFWSNTHYSPSGLSLFFFGILKIFKFAKIKCNKIQLKIVYFRWFHLKSSCESVSNWHLSKSTYVEMSVWAAVRNDCSQRLPDLFF